MGTKRDLAMVLEMMGIEERTTRSQLKAKILGHIHVEWDPRSLSITFRKYMFFLLGPAENSRIATNHYDQKILNFISCKKEKYIILFNWKNKIDHPYSLGD
jgi:hypothetical protein